ncbi:MAG TPA: DUF4079 family protein [bacterium]
MKELVPVIQVLHAVFNAALFAAFIVQGTLGWRIRRRRLSGASPDFAAVKKHRSRGPLLAKLAVAGYLAGLVTAYLHRGTLVTAPAHLAGGTILLACCWVAVVLGGRIRGPQSPARTQHLAAGGATLVAFVVQVFLGLNVLL